MDLVIVTVWAMAFVGKHSETSCFVHHSEIQCCQSISTIMHVQQLIACGVASFNEKHSVINLALIIQVYESSSER